MRKILLKNIFGFLLFSLSIGLAIAEDWPEISHPPESKVVWVGDDINQNGLPMKVKKFNSDLDIQGVIGFYRAEWSTDSEFTPVENDLDDWKIIGKQTGDFYLTVQAKLSEDSTSEGFLTVSKLPVVSAIGPDLDTDFPVMSGTDLMSKTSTNDIGSSGETLVFKNDFSIQSNVSFYKSEMRSLGWDITREDIQPSTSTGDIAKFIYFKRSKEACSIVISSNEHGDTVLVVNKAKY